MIKFIQGTILGLIVFTIPMIVYVLSTGGL